MMPTRTSIAETHVWIIPRSRIIQNWPVPNPEVIPRMRMMLIETRPYFDPNCEALKMTSGSVFEFGVVLHFCRARGL